MTIPLVMSFCLTLRVEADLADIAGNDWPFGLHQWDSKGVVDHCLLNRIHLHFLGIRQLHWILVEGACVCVWEGVCASVTHPEGILAVPPHRLILPHSRFCGYDSRRFSSLQVREMICLSNLVCSFPLSLVTPAVRARFLVLRCLISSTFLSFLLSSFLTLHSKPTLLRS